jgi:hypothetical protein
MTRLWRAAFALLLALLLVGMQQEAFRHALSHLKPAQALHVSTTVVDAPCVECALVAGGSAALSGNPAVLPTTAAILDTTSSAAVARSPSRPSYYRSRAPPSLS